MPDEAGMLDKIIWIATRDSRVNVRLCTAGLSKFDDRHLTCRDLPLARALVLSRLSSSGPIFYVLKVCKYSTHGCPLHAASNAEITLHDIHFKRLPAY